MGLTPNEQAEDREVSNFKLELPNDSLKRASRIQSKLENSRFAKYFLLLATMLGTSMVIGDGVLTPCISGLWAADTCPLFFVNINFVAYLEFVGIRDIF